MALLIKRPVDWQSGGSCRVLFDLSGCAQIVSHEAAQVVSVICRIRHHMPDPSRPFDQATRLRAVAPLPRRDAEADRQAGRIHRGVDFRGQPAFGATEKLALTDALGNLVPFVLMPEHRFDTFGVAPLIKGIKFDAMPTDKAFDRNRIIAKMHERGALICISQHPRRSAPLPIDPELHKIRHLIEKSLCKLKEFKGVAIRADKTDTSFRATIYALAAFINSR